MSVVCTIVDRMCAREVCTSLVALRGEVAEVLVEQADGGTALRYKSQENPLQ